MTLPASATAWRERPSRTLCGAPLGPADYLAIAEAVEVLMLDDIPALSRARNNEAKRFVTLIDALYEAKVRLVCSAAAEPDALYPRARAPSSSPAPPRGSTRCGAPAGAASGAMACKGVYS